MPNNLRDLIDKYNLSAVADLILAKVKPALYLTLGAACEGEQGCTRIGGTPELPPDLAWPVDDDGDPMTFAMQINLADVPMFKDNPLPTSGLLSVFVALDLGLCTPVTAVYYFSDINACQPRNQPNINLNEQFEAIIPHHLHLTWGYDLPLFNSNIQQSLVDEITLSLPNADAEALQDNYYELTKALMPSQTIVKLLGYAEGIDQDPYEDAYVVAEVNPDWLYNFEARENMDMTGALKWQHLMSIYSNVELDLCIYDFGTLQCFIQRSDLKDQYFGRVHAAPMST